MRCESLPERDGGSAFEIYIKVALGNSQGGIARWLESGNVYVFLEVGKRDGVMKILVVGLTQSLPK